MSKDKSILIVIWIVMGGFLFKLIPKNNIRQGTVAYLFMQLITWVFGLLVVEKGLIKYPVRFFKKANKSSFSFEYFFYPAFCAIFNLYYPENKTRFLRLFYLLSHAGLLTILEVILEKYTNLIKYVHWKWYWSFITMGMSYYASRRFYCWFFKEELKTKTEDNS